MEQLKIGLWPSCRDLTDSTTVEVTYTIGISQAVPGFNLVTEGLLEAIVKIKTVTL